MECALFLDVVVRQGSAIFELLSSENESLLVGRDAFLVLDLSLHVLDGVVGFDVQGDGLSRKGLDEDLHDTTSKSEDQVEGGLLLDVVVGEGAAVLKLLARKDEALLVRGDSCGPIPLLLAGEQTHGDKTPLLGHAASTLAKGREKTSETHSSPGGTLMS